MGLKKITPKANQRQTKGKQWVKKAADQGIENAQKTLNYLNKNQAIDNIKPFEADIVKIEPPKESIKTMEGVEVTQMSQTSTKKGLSIYTHAIHPRGTVIILHGCDERSGAIVQALHNNLPQAGWNTLSLELPTLSTASTYKDLGMVMPTVETLIEKSIADTKSKSQLPIVLLAHSCGSQMALTWIEKRGSDSIDAYIGIGTGIMNATLDVSGHVNTPMENMKFPQLDIFGTADNETVKKTSPERLKNINRAANPASRQKMITDADHNMTGKGELVSKVISEWLNRRAFR
jgi:hypothetical protein